jgi:uncharacterized membrane protein
MSPSHFHPMLVHFPIALVMFGFLAECAALYFKKEVYLPKMGFFLLIAGTLTAICALLSGVLFTGEMSGAAGDVKSTHSLMAWITLALLAVTSILRIILFRGNSGNSGLKWLAFALFGLAAITVSVTGFFGGTLVYNYMMPL